MKSIVWENGGLVADVVIDATGRASRLSVGGRVRRRRSTIDGLTQSSIEDAPGDRHSKHRQQIGRNVGNFAREPAPSLPAGLTCS